MSLGVIPPKKKAYSATVFQVKVNQTIAPNGISVFGFTPHMHALGKKMWVEKLSKQTHNEEKLLLDLAELTKASRRGHRLA